MKRDGSCNSFDYTNPIGMGSFVYLGNDKEAILEWIELLKQEPGTEKAVELSENIIKDLKETERQVNSIIAAFEFRNKIDIESLHALWRTVYDKDYVKHNRRISATVDHKEFERRFQEQLDLFNQHS